MALRLPLKSSGVTTSCVTLHRPPPEMMIFAPSFFAPSSATTRAPFLRCEDRRRQPRGAGADDGDVIHARGDCDAIP